MQIIEKKVYERGGNDNYQSSTRQRANAGLTLGIIGTVAGVAALWNRNAGGGIASILSGGGATGSGGGSPSNVNINCSGGYNSPSPFIAYSKECEDILNLTNSMWGLKLNTMQDLIALRNTDVAEKFGLWKSQVDSDFALYKDNRDNIDSVNNRINNELFSLYKYTRDKDDETRKELCDLKAQIAVNSAVRPYQDKLIQCEIDKAFTAAMTALERRTCKMLEGVVTLPTEPTVTGLISQTCCNRALFGNGGGAGA